MVTYTAYVVGAQQIPVCLTVVTFTQVETFARGRNQVGAYLCTQERAFCDPTGPLALPIIVLVRNKRPSNRLPTQWEGGGFLPEPLWMTGFVSRST